MPERYSGALVVIHWISAILVIGALGLGLGVLADMPNSNPEKLGYLRIHFIVGVLVLVLTVARLVVRFRKPVPSSEHFDSPFLNRLGRYMHIGMYALLFGVLLSGIGLSALSGLPEAIFQTTGALPTDFNEFPPHKGHAILGRLLAAAILLHLVAALFHQFIRDDGIFRRMWFGKG